MERENIQLDYHLLGEIVNNAIKITHSDRACLLLYNQTLDRLECHYGQNCLHFAKSRKERCIVPFKDMTQRLRNLCDDYGAIGYIAEGREFQTKKSNGATNSCSQMLIPLSTPQSKPLGLLVFESNYEGHFREEDIRIAQSVAGLCVLVLQKSQQLTYVGKMIGKLKLLSKASNVLLAEFENKPLPEKFDFIVEKTTEILDAELCSLWLVKDGHIRLETSYSQKGKVRFKEGWILPIKDGPRSGMTGHIAFHKKIFNAYGNEIDNHPARNPDNPVDFLPSQKVYSQLAYPLLDEGQNLIGLLFAYNKKDAKGQPLKNAGFSKEFDEPLMKILTTKLLISIKNAELVKKLRGYELIVESTPDPVIINSKDGVITYMNPGAKNLFGDLIGCQVADCYPSDETSTGLEKAREIKRQLYKTTDKRLKNFETKFTSKNGEAIPISLSVSLLYDEHGNEAGTIGIAKDLRAIKALLATGQALLETHDIDKILKKITQVCLRLPNSVRAYIKLYDEKNDNLAFRALSSRNPDEQFPGKFAPKERGMTGYVFMSQKPLWSNDVSTLPIERYHAIFKDVKSKIVVPITYTDKETGIVRKRGVISVDSEDLNAFSPNDVYFLTSLANQAAVALENATLIASKNKIIIQLQAFERVQQTATGKNPDRDKIFDGILSAVVDILGFAYATISLVDEERQMIGTIKGRNVADEFIKLAWHSLESRDIQAWAYRHKEAIYLTGWDDRLDKGIYEKYQHEQLVRTIIPIIARGEVLGTLETGYYKVDKNQIEKDEIETLQRIVNLAGIGIEQANLLNRLKEDIALTNELEKQLDALNRASIQILNSTTEKEAIDHIFKSLESIGYTKAMLSLINDVSKKIEGKYALGENWKSIVDDTKVDLSSDDILAQALQAGIPLLSQNCAKDPRCNLTRVRKAKVRSQYVIPLLVKDKPIGTLQIDLSDKQDLVHGDEAHFQRKMKVLETFASQSAIAIRNIRDVVTIDRLEANIAETAHEFRSPLHNIMTQLGGLKDYLEYSKSEQEIDQFINIIEEEIYRAKRQVDNSLLLSERTQETMEFDFKEGYLQDVIKSCADAYKLRALERGIRIIIKDGVKHLPKIKFDRDKIEQAITNLIDNAVKYSHFNQYVEINGFDDGTQINVEITDRGLGIPSNELEAVFRGFTRGGAKDRIRYIPGTGLGLKICKEIIEKHDGEIKVTKSVPLSRNPQKVQEYQDYETTFRLTLPKFRRE